MSKSQSHWEKMRKVTTMKHPNVTLIWFSSTKCRPFKLTHSIYWHNQQIANIFHTSVGDNVRHQVKELSLFCFFSFARGLLQDFLADQKMCSSILTPLSPCSSRKAKKSLFPRGIAKLVKDVGSEGVVLGEGGGSWSWGRMGSEKENVVVSQDLLTHEAKVLKLVLWGGDKSGLCWPKACSFSAWSSAE